MRFPPVSPRRLFALTAALCSAVVVQAMSVIAPTFDELVAESELVVRGLVTDVRCVAVDTSQGTAVKTLVTLRVERALKGNPGAELTLSLLGGKVGKRTLTVLGMPTFKPGDREIVFVANNGRVMCPLIAGGYGRYHVRHDAAANRDYVTRHNDMPLVSVADVARSMAAVSPALPSAAMSVDAFESRILTAVKSGPARVQP